MTRARSATHWILLAVAIVAGILWVEAPALWHVPKWGGVTFTFLAVELVASILLVAVIRQREREQVAAIKREHDEKIAAIYRERDEKIAAINRDLTESQRRMLEQMNAVFKPARLRKYGRPN